MNILFIDTENFKEKIKKVLRSENVKTDIVWHNYDFKGLFNSVLNGLNIDRKIFYAGKIELNPMELVKSEELIAKQRLLKRSVENQGFEFIFAGKVRGNIDERTGRIIFKEKGVDVRMAVDMLSMSHDGTLKQAILASSDSDLQPAIKELKKRNVECVYLGFENYMNKGMTYTSPRTILIRNSEVLKFIG